MKGKTSHPLILMIMALGALAAGAGANYWQFSTTQELQGKVNATKAELGSRSELQAQLVKSQQDLDIAKQDLTHLESNVTSLESVPTLLQDLQKTGESCNLKIEGVRPVVKNDTKKKKGNDRAETPADRPVRKAYEEIDVEVKCRGSFVRTMAFLKKLEDFPKIVGVRQMSIMPKLAQDGKSLDSLETTIRIRVYVFPIVPGTPVQGAPVNTTTTTAGTTSAPNAPSAASQPATTNALQGRYIPGRPVVSPQMGGR